MVEFDALYYDGRSSASRRVRAQGFTSELRILGDGIDERVPLKAVAVEPPIGNTPREFFEQVRADLLRWAEVVKAANVKVE